MSFALACLLSTALFAPQDDATEPVAQEPELPTPEPTVATDDGPLWRAVESEEQLRQDLEALTTEFPRWADLRLLQPDRESPPMHMLVLGEREIGDPSKRPALLLLPELSTADRRSTSTLVAVARRFCRQLDGERPLSSLLERATIYVIPAPVVSVFDPLEEPAPSRLVELDRNFPSSWRPARSGAAGPYPLSEPECQAIADFLYWRSNLAACFEITSQSPERNNAPTLLVEREAKYSAKLTWMLSGLGAEEPVVYGLDVLQAGPGSLRRYADRALGLWTFLEAPSNEAVADTFGSSEVMRAESTLIATHSLTDRVVALAQTLPRLEVGAVEVELLAEDLWRIDVPISNAGGLATGARHRAEPTARVRLELEGADFAATMVRGASGEAFVPLAASGARVDLGHFEGGEARVLRAIVKASAGAELTVRVRAARAGSVAVRVALPE